MKNLLLLLLLIALSVSLKAQIQIGDLLNDKPSWGAPHIRYANRLNGLYGATSNWNVTSSLTNDINQLNYLFDDDLDNNVTVPAGSTHTFVLDYRAKHLNDGYTNSIIYGSGTVLLHFYYTSVPASVELKVYNNPADPTLFQRITMQNISSSSALAVYSGAFPALLYVTRIDITVTAGANNALLCEIQYVLDRPISQQLDNAFITNYHPQTIFQSFNWKDNTNTLSAKINPSGNSFFLKNVGFGNANPRTFLDVSGSANHVLNSVLARLPEADNVSEGTYLGVRANTTQPIDVSSFSLEHKFGGQLNNSINFYRGGSYQGGFMSFSTNDGSEKMRIMNNGNVGIGTVSPPEKLSVEGTIAARKIKVTQANWPDYVFENKYLLRSLDSLEVFVNLYSHLPEVPSAKQVQIDGLDIGENQAILLKKIEELTLYLINMKKDYTNQFRSQQRIINEQAAKLAIQAEQINHLKNHNK